MSEHVSEVTRDNFETVIPEFIACLQDASFVALDCEFSGLAAPDACVNRQTRFDTPRERFDRARASVSAFTLLQFGVCVFTYDSATKRLGSRPFNFYCFPRPFESRDESCFTCQTSSMAFLASHGFNFQRWIADGIPHLSYADEAKVFWPDLIFSWPVSDLSFSLFFFFSASLSLSLSFSISLSLFLSIFFLSISVSLVSMSLPVSPLRVCSARTHLSPT